jgi:hypothetical protein
MDKNEGGQEGQDGHGSEKLKTSKAAQMKPAKQPGNKGEKAKDEDEPYSPTSAAEEMDWESNLPGVKPLFDPPSPNRKDREGPEEKGAKGESSSGSSSGSNSDTDDLANSSSSDEENEDESDKQHDESGKKKDYTAEEDQAKKEELQEKVKSYLEKKKKNDNMMEIRRRIGQDLMMYNAIQAGCARSTAADDLLGGRRSTIPLPPGIVDNGDGRVLSGGLKIDMADRKVISTSFDSDWKCLACNHPVNRSVLNRPGSGDNNVAQAFILGDQSIPAVLPCSSKKL